MYGLRPPQWFFGCDSFPRLSCLEKDPWSASDDDRHGASWGSTTDVGKRGGLVIRVGLAVANGELGVLFANLESGDNHGSMLVRMVIVAGGSNGPRTL